MRRVDVTDLLGPGYRRGIRDCFAVACTALGRAGVEVDPDRAEEELLRWVVSEGSPWEKVGSEPCHARVLGDVLFLSSEDAPCGVAVLVDEQTRAAITATPERGVFLLPLRMVKDCAGVYRWRPA